MTDQPSHDRFTLPGDISDSEVLPVAPDGRNGEVAARSADGGALAASAPMAPPPPCGRSPSPSLRDGEDRAPQPERIGDPLPPLPGAEPVPTSAEGAGAWTVFTPERRAVFLDQLTAHGEVRLACRGAGVSPQTAYRARARSRAFALAWDAARLAARPAAEDALACRAIDGWLEPVFYRGEKIDSRRRYCSRLLLAHLARLDKLAETPGIEGALPVLDDVIQTLREGRDMDEVLEEAVAAQEEANSSLDPVPGVPSSSAEEPAPEPCEECGGKCNGPEWKLTQADCQWLGNRLARMDRARPRGVDKPYQLARGDLDTGEIEALQLEAFEAGVERWWELTGAPDEEGAGGEGECAEFEEVAEEEEAEPEPEPGPEPEGEPEPKPEPEVRKGPRITVY